MSLSRKLNFAQNTYLFKYQVFYLEYMLRLTLTFYTAAQWCDKLFIPYSKWMARLFTSLWRVFRL
jgi:hypothetical protein